MSSPVFEIRKGHGPFLPLRREAFSGFKKNLRVLLEKYSKIKRLKKVRHVAHLKIL